MSLAFLVAFGGPLAIGLLAFAVALVIAPRHVRHLPAAESIDETVGSKLVAVERAARRAADDIAEVRQRLAIGQK
jgi:hypothetical protein